MINFDFHQSVNQTTDWNLTIEANQPIVHNYSKAELR